MFGTILLWEVCRYFRHGWIATFYVKPTFHFTYYGFDWIAPWPGQGMYVHFAALGVLAGLLVVGLWYRISAALFFLGFAYVFLLDEAQYLNHWYLVVLIAFLLALVPAHRAFSIDAWRAPAWRAETAPAWALWLLRAQLGIVYFYAGVAKLNGDWLRGEPLREWLARDAGFPLIANLFGKPGAVLVVAYAVLLLDLCITPLLLWRRTFLPAFIAAVAFHVLNWRLFGLGIFPWFMIGMTFFVFVPADRLRRWLRLAPPGEPAVHFEYRRATVVMLGAYLAVQLVLPLRHHLYPGDVNWTEEGHRFSWHMMLRSKTADMALWAVDPFRARAWKIDLWRYVTPRQRQAMATDPDMIRQLSRHVAVDLERQGHGRVRIHALVQASLHRRQAQWLVDPRANLADEARTLMPASWIVPLGDPAAAEWLALRSRPPSDARHTNARDGDQAALSVLEDALHREREMKKLLAQPEGHLIAPREYGTEPDVRGR